MYRGHGTLTARLEKAQYSRRAFVTVAIIRAQLVLLSREIKSGYQWGIAGELY
jgi:hypothetical protein